MRWRLQQWFTKRKEQANGWLYLLLGAPTATEWVETGRPPHAARELLTDVLLTLVVGWLVWRVRRHHQRLVNLNGTDALTGLYNRRRFSEDLAREVERTSRLGTGVALAIIDIDRFKDINDCYGHSTGDRVLIDVGRILSGWIRARVDTCYRIGGDEFAILLPVSSPADAHAASNRFARVIDGPIELLDRYGAGLSVGFAQYEEGDLPESLMRRADEDMYRAKRARSSSRSVLQASSFQPTR